MILPQLLNLLLKQQPKRWDQAPTPSRVVTVDTKLRAHHRIDTAERGKKNYAIILHATANEALFARVVGEAPTNTVVPPWSHKPATSDFQRSVATHASR